MTSQLTKEGLVRAKARGVKLGSPKIKQTQPLAVKQIKSNADDFAQKLAPTIAALVNSGIVRDSHICKHLNEMGIKARRGGVFYPAQVKNLRARIEAMNLIP